MTGKEVEVHDGKEKEAKTVRFKESKKLSGLVAARLGRGGRN